MTVKTKLFGTIEIDENKVVTFENGMIGFPSLKQFLLIYDQEKKEKITIYWLQSLDEPSFSLPVIDPLVLLESYKPIIDDDLLKAIEEPAPSDMLVFSTLTVPSDYEKMTANLKAPILINGAAKKGCQIIVENEDYQVRFPIYDILSQKQEGTGE